MLANKKIITYKFIKFGYEQPNTFPIRKKNYGYTNPELYLQLLENKQKIKQDCRNTDYIPIGNTLETDDEEVPTTDDLFIIPAQKQVNDTVVSNTDKTVNDDFQKPNELLYNNLKRKHNGVSLSFSPKRPKPLIDDYSTKNNMRHNDVSLSYSAKRHRTLLDVDYSAKIDEIEKAAETPKPINNFYERDRPTDDIQSKQHLIAKLNMLRHQYPDENIPYVTMNDDLVYIRSTYDIIVKNLNLYDKHEKYKQILTVGFFVIEFVFGKFLKLNMAGFAEEQIKNFGKYDKLLIELGEKNYIPDAPEKFPVELRLLGMVVIQAAIFVLMNKFCNGVTTGSGGILDILTSFMLPKQDKTQTNNEKPQASRMKGPQPFTTN